MVKKNIKKYCGLSIPAENLRNLEYRLDYLYFNFPDKICMQEYNIIRDCIRRLGLQIKIRSDETHAIIYNTKKYEYIKDDER